MGTTYHRHRGGAEPHVHHHHHDDGAAHHHHGDGHGHHVYDAQGHRAAVVEGDPHELGHWHFERPFSRITLAPSFELAIEAVLDPASFIAEPALLDSQTPRGPPSLT